MGRGGELIGRDEAEGLDFAYREGWTSAWRLYDHVAKGGQLPVLPPTTVRLRPDEVAHADAVLGYARFYGTTVGYTQHDWLLLGSAGFVVVGMAASAIATNHARRRAEAQAAAQWRDHAQVRTMLTNQRLLCDYGGEWLSFWHNGVVELHSDLTQWTSALRYEVGAPIMLHGVAVPWFAVILAHVLYGPRGLQLPAFAPLAGHGVVREIASGD